MRGRTGTGALPGALLIAALAAAGCCGLGREGTSAHLNRDTPEAALRFVREAFAGDRTGDQYDSYHPDFREAQGLTAGNYALARSLRPGLFRRAASLLGEAEILAVAPGAALLPTRRGPRSWVRMDLATPGGRAVLRLVDEPSFLLATDDEELGPVTGPLPDLDRAVRIRDGALEVVLRVPLPVPPLEGSRIRRVEVHHDWLLYDIEVLEGFDDFLEEVRSAAAEAGTEEGAP